jgi:hypothetical protein
VKTVDFQPGPDVVLGEGVFPDGTPGVKVRRKVAFLTEPEGNMISTVAVPANKTRFVAVKGAVAPHDTAKAPEGAAWDGAAAEGRLRKWASSDGTGDKGKVDWAKYREGFAWYDGAAGEDFGSYKLPHHDVADGRLVVVWGGVAAAMGALAGARGGVSIPEGDVAGVRAHLAKHYEQFGKEPPAEAAKEADVGATAANDDAVVAQKAGVLDRVLSALGLRAAQKGAVVSFTGKLAREELMDDFCDAKWALNDVLWTILFDSDVEGDRAALAKQAVAEFGARVDALLAQHATALKSAGDDEAAACKALGAAGKCLAEKAGKVLSGANLARIQAATAALTQVLETATPAESPATAAAEAGEAPAAAASGDGADAAAGKAKAAEEGAMDQPGVQAGAEQAKKAADALSALKSARTEDERQAALKSVGELLGVSGEPSVEERVEKAVGVKAAAIEAAVGAKIDGLAQAIKQALGMDAPADAMTPEDKALLARMKGAQTPDQAAQDLEGQERGPAKTGLGAGPAVPGNDAVKVGELAQKMAAMQAELDALKGARPAGSDLPVTARKAAGEAGAGWSNGLNLF